MNEALTFLFLINRGTQLGFDLYDRIMRGEIDAEAALAEWKQNASELKLEEARFDRLMGGASGDAPAG